MKKAIILVFVAIAAIFLNLTSRAIAFDDERQFSELSHRVASNSVVPLTNCVLGSLIFKETPLGSTYGCAVGVSLGMIDEIVRSVTTIKSYLLSSALIGVGILKPLENTKVQALGAGLGLASSYGLIDPNSIFSVMKQGLNALILTRAVELPFRYAADSLGYSHIGLEKEAEQMMSFFFAVLLSSDSFWKLFSSEIQETSVLPDMRDFLSNFTSVDSRVETGSREIMTAISSQLILTSLDIHIWRGLGEFFNAYETFKTDPEAAWKRVSTQLRPSLMQVGVYVILSTFYEKIVMQMHQTLVYEASYNIESQLFSDENILKLSKINSTEHLLSGMGRDFDTVRITGQQLISSELGNKIETLYSSNVMYGQEALDYYAFLFIYNKLVDQITRYLAKWESQLKEDLNKCLALQNALLSDATSQATLITLNQKADELGKKRALLNLEMSSLQDKTYYIVSVFNMWKKTKDFVDFILSNFIISYKMSSDPSVFDRRSEFNHAGQSISKTLSWSSMKAEEINALKLAIKNLAHIAEKIKSNEMNSCDNLVHNFIRNEEDTYIELNDVWIHSDDFSKSLHIPYLKLEMGFYAVVGASGGGKSTLMHKIFSVKNDGICASGSINFHSSEGYPEKPYMLTQKFYATPQSTLFEVLTGKQKQSLSEREYQQLKERIVELFLETEIDTAADPEKGLASELEVVKDWNNPLYLSGGQAKKIAAISLFLRMEGENPPRFILIDEILSGLDEENSLQRMKWLLKKYLKNTVVLIVDHGNKDFFDKALVFSKGTASLKTW